MKLKEIAEAIAALDPSLACRVSQKKMQILLYCSNWPDEVTTLLSPYYQNRVHLGIFDEEDLMDLYIEAESFMKYGV